jgi:hypothetical protein
LTLNFGPDHNTKMGARVFSTILTRGVGHFAFGWVCVAAIAGCGVAEYEELMAQRLVTLRKEAAFDALDRPELVSQDHEVWIRIPKHFAGAQRFSRVRDPATEKPKPKPKEGEETSGELTPEEEAEQSGVGLPQFLKNLPGFGRVGVQSEQLEKRAPPVGVYYYFALVDQSKMKPSEVRAEVQQSIRAQWAGLSATWEAVKIETPDGKTVDVHRMLASGNMPFDRYEAINPNAPSYPGVLGLYCLELPSQTVLWGVRVPEALNQRLGLARLAEAAAGTIEPREEAPESNDGKSQTAAP